MLKLLKNIYCNSASTIPAILISAQLVITPAYAEETKAAEEESAEAEENRASTSKEIVVYADRIRGSVDTKVPPVQVLGEGDVAALGASSVTEILAAIAPQTGSGRGRGGGQPVVLLNGQRISGFRELRDLPPEAIKRVEIFPEEVALQYGFRPDQRVVNIILQDNYSAFTVETDILFPEDGGYNRKKIETVLTSIGKNSRLNISMQFTDQGSLTEDERNIISSSNTLFALDGNITAAVAGGTISPALNNAAGQNVTVAAIPAGTSPNLAAFAANANRPASNDIGTFRTLSPARQNFVVNGTWTKVLAPQSNISFNMAYTLDDSQRLLGLPFASILLPGSSPFSPFGNDVLINRYFETPRALTRQQKNQDIQGALSYNSLLSGWRLALTADYSLSDNETSSNSNADFSALRSEVSVGALNPFSPDFGSDLLFASTDLTDSQTTNLSLRATLSGAAFSLPAGEVQMTLRGGFDRQAIDSIALRRGTESAVDLSRSNSNAAFSFDIPILQRGSEGLGVIGDLGINGNFGFTKLSDFGTLIEYGAGLRWSPLKGLNFLGSYIVDENAPGLGQLGNPILVTPNVQFFDFSRNDSSLVELVSGGNPNLRDEKRRDLKFSAIWSPSWGEKLGLGLSADYIINRSKNTTSAFPILTPEIETAFASRVSRDSAGRLIRVDQRPVNFAEENSKRIRWGINLSGGIGPQPQRGGGPASGEGRGGEGRGGEGRGGPGSERPRQQPAGGGAGGGGPGAGRGGGGLGMLSRLSGGQPGRWQLSLYHNYSLDEKILIAQGVPVLDLLNGSALNNNGGAARHSLELSGGVFAKGMGMRFEGSYRSGTRINGSPSLGSGDLFFDDQLNLDAFFFVSFDQRGNLIKKIPFLKGSRVALRVRNLFNDYVAVRDANGITPLSYQRGFIDPQGRSFELSYRKRF